jgi:hypothetical protein
MFWNNHYYLLQAFDLLGRQLYPDSWTGYEHESREVISPEELKARRDPLEREVEELKQVWADASNDLKERLPTAEERAAISAKIDSVRDRCNELEELLFEMGKPDASHIRDYNKWQRMIEVRDRLYEAFRTEALKPLFDGSTFIEWDYWLRNDGCKIFLPISMMTTSRNMSGKRRGSVTVEKVPFDKWLSRIEPREGENSHLSRARTEFTNEILKEAESGERTRYRDDWIHVGTEKYGLSANEAKKIWQANTLPKWRRKGRPKLNG